MSVPTHGPTCRTVMWPTRCPDCRRAVYFFSCSCGSRVFFNFNRPPWDPHQDGCIPYLVRDLRDRQGFGPGDVVRMVERHAAEHHLVIDPVLHKELLNADATTRHRPTVIEVVPAALICDILGEVVQVDERINFFKMAGYPDNQASRAFLGMLAKEEHAAVTLHVADAPAGFIAKFRVHLPLPSVKRAGIHKGTKVFLTIKGHELPTGQLIWLSSGLEDVARAGLP